MSEAADKITIPEKHQEFARALGRLCREHGLTKFSGSYQPDFRDMWPGDIQIIWEDGRHGEDSDRVRIISQVRVDTRLGPPPQKST